MAKLADYELKAWHEYDAVVDKYNQSHRVKMYDRVSIHENFPEILAAFEKCLSMRTFRILKDGKKNED